MTMLNLTEIMEAEDVTEKDVEVSEWGGTVRVRSLSHRTMRKIKKDIAAQGEEATEDALEIQLLVKGMVEPSVSVEEAEHLMDKSSSAIMKILNAILGQSKAGEKSVKEEEKNFRPESE